MPSPSPSLHFTSSVRSHVSFLSYISGNLNLWTYPPRWNGFLAKSELFFFNKMDIIFQFLADVAQAKEIWTNNGFTFNFTSLHYFCKITCEFSKLHIRQSQIMNVPSKMKMNFFWRVNFFGHHFSVSRQRWSSINCIDHVHWRYNGYWIL